MVKDSKPAFDADAIFAAFRAPGFDVQSFVAAQQRNIDALTQANKLALEGLQTVARRNAEIIRSGMDEAAGFLREVASSKSPEESLEKQTAATKRALEQSVANAKELTEIISKASTEAFEIIQKRLSEGLEEAQTIVAKTAKK